MRKKVVILGGGFGGLNAAKILGKTPKFDVLLIDSTNHHLFQPLLYQVACAALHPADIAVPLREILKNYPNITVIMAEAVRIDKENREIFFPSEEKVTYDFLIVAVGSRHSYFGKDEWEALAPGLKGIGDALEIRSRMLCAYEHAEKAKLFHGKDVANALNFVIIGGGPTGVELAGALSEIANKTLIRNFRRIQPSSAKIILIEAAERILPQFPPELSERAAKDLQKLDVQILTHTRVTNVDEKGVYVNGSLIPTENIFWAAGNQANPLLATLEVPLDKHGRVFVQPDLSLTGFPELFIIGDAACALDENNQPLPALAPVAKQQGIYVAKVLLNRDKASSQAGFVYKDMGMIATIGTKHAVGVVLKHNITGLFAWLIWNVIHIANLIGFDNKLIVMIGLGYNYLLNNRISRLIYKAFAFHR